MEAYITILGELYKLDILHILGSIRLVEMSRSYKFN